MTTDYKIMHATDLHAEGGIAFAHSVALARDMGAELYSIHASVLEEKEELRPMPDATALLASWAKSSHTEQNEIVHHTIKHSCCDDPVNTLLDALVKISPDLLVVGTHQRKGMERFVKGCVSESLLLNSSVPTLLLPVGKTGFVQEWSGRNQLQRILIPVATMASATAGIQHALDMIERTGRPEVEIYLLHVGDDNLLDGVNTPQREGIVWHRLRHDGELEAEIASICEQYTIDLVVMATEGQNSFLDVLTGTHTQKTIRNSNCPILAIPLNGD